MRSLGCGVIGLGTIGRLYCGLAAERRGLPLRILAAADPHETEGPPGVELYRGHPEMLARRDVEAVLIATPARLHYAHALDALEAGKDVLVEKPPAASVRDAERLAAVAAERGRVLFFAYHARYGRGVRRARRALGAPHGAAIRSINAAFREDVFRFHDPGSWVLREGVVRDSGINVFSVLTCLAPGLRVVDAALERDASLDAVTRARIDLAMASGGSARVELDWTFRGADERRIVVRTPSGEWTIDVAGNRLLRDGRCVWSGGANSLAREYAALLRHFAWCVRRRRSWCGVEEVRLVEEAVG